METIAHRINLYQSPPEQTLSMDTLEALCLKRLLLLKKVEFLIDSGESDKNLLEQTFKFGREQDLMMATTDDAESQEFVWQNDNISHFICRLAYSRSEELRTWFQMQESRLFRVKIMRELLARDRGDKGAFLSLFLDHINVGFEDVTREEWDEVGPSISYMMKSKDNPAPGHFIKVPFKKALPIVQRRSCFVYKGFAYLSKERHLETLISEFFKSDLNRVLLFT